MKEINEFLNPLEGKKQHIIELFVKAYGEQYREQITSQIENTEFIWTYSELKPCLLDLYHNEKQKIISAFFRKYGYEGQPVFFHSEKLDYIQNMLSLKPEFILSDLSEEAYIKLLNLPENFSSLDESSQIKYLTENKQSLNQRLNILKEVWNKEFKQEFDAISKKSDEIADNYKDKKEVETKYREKLLNVLQNHLKSKIQNEDSLLFISMSFQNILSFGKDAIINPEFDFYKNSFIDFCNDLGYNFGDDYSKYLTPEILDFVFDEEIIKRFNEINAEQELEIVKLSSIEKNIEQINNMDFANGNAQHLITLYKFITDSQNTAAYCSNFMTTDGTAKTLCVCPINVPDSVILHELGHVMQFKELFENPDFVFVKCGVACTALDKNNSGNITTVEELHKRKDENLDNISMQTVYNLINNTKMENYVNFILSNPILLNEVINEYLTTKICKIANNKNFAIIEPSTSCISTYTIAFPLLQDFLETNQKKIIECAMSSDLFKFEKFIGKENHEELSNIIKNLLSIYAVTKVSKSITEKANNMNLSVNELAHKESDDLSYSERQFLKCYLDAEKVLQKIDKHISANAEKDKQS